MKEVIENRKGIDPSLAPDGLFPVSQGAAGTAPLQLIFGYNSLIYPVTFLITHSIGPRENFLRHKILTIMLKAKKQTE